MSERLADAAALPDDSVLGIPENMFSDASRRILGTGGAWRAYVDRLRPPLTIGHELLYDEAALALLQGEFKSAALPALQRLKASEPSGLGAAVDDNIRLLATEIEKRCFGLELRWYRAGNRNAPAVIALGA